MSTESSRDDFIIAIRSAFLKKGNRQKFSLFTLLIISILVLSLEYFKTGPVNQFRSITKDIIFRGSYVVSGPFKYVKDKYYLFQDHMSMYEEFSVLRDKDLDLDSLRKEVDFYKSENALLKKLIEERDLFSKEFMLTKILLDKQSPYMKSLIINKGQKNGVKLGSAVKDRLYYIGKVVNVNFLSARVLLANDLNSKIPIIIEPSGINAILSGNGNDDYAELEYLPKDNEIKENEIVYTSGSDGTIPASIPVGKIIIQENKKYVKFFSNLNQLNYVQVNK
jgi:rod shape-determining protein MreC